MNTAFDNNTRLLLQTLTTLDANDDDKEEGKK